MLRSKLLRTSNLTQLSINSKPITYGLRSYTAAPQPKSKTKGIVFNNRNPTLNDFLDQYHQSKITGNVDGKKDIELVDVPYLNGFGIGQEEVMDIKPKTYFTEVYGCQIDHIFGGSIKTLYRNKALYICHIGEKEDFVNDINALHGKLMNVSDAEILSAVMAKAGYIKTPTLEGADIVFLVTCSIRDKAEQKIWHRLAQLKKLVRNHHPKKLPPMVGVLGCMAERLKEKLLEHDKLVDLVCGPDAYRSIPHLIDINCTTTQGVANVILSADETYADIVPIRQDETSTSVYISIMRGCNNMCSYCIVPFTRGIERSRPIASIVEEVKRLSKLNVKEVVLLGQNVNSYRDTSQQSIGKEEEEHLSNEGFDTIYKRKDGGLRFAELVRQVAEVDPEMRIRFTSPHPKDFPDALLNVVKQYPNVCNCLHLPAQSGNTAMLQRMRRGYSREAYLQLINRVKQTIPDVAITSDFIAGFCGETEAEHLDTITLMEQVQYDQAYMFAYSLREKTHAHRQYKDDVPNPIKKQRLNEIIATFHHHAKIKHDNLINKPQLVLIDGKPHQKHLEQGRLFMGRTDGNHKAFIQFDPYVNKELYDLQAGDYVAFMPLSANLTSITGIPLEKTTLQRFFKEREKYTKV